VAAWSRCALREGETVNITTKTKTGETIATYKAHALIVIAGTETHKLALHKDDWGTWKVTEPESGGLIVRVKNHYKGVPVSSRTLTLKAARALAMAQVDDLIERIGTDSFNATLARAKAKTESA
jgi:hypothetical protein